MRISVPVPSFKRKGHIMEKVDKLKIKTISAGCNGSFDKPYKSYYKLYDKTDMYF
jgi:hypothetical protein